MVKVSKIKVTEFNLIDELNNKSNKKMQQCLSLISIEEAKKYLPTKSKFTVCFELTETNADIANAVRRVLMDEIKVLSFDFNEYEDFISSDPYILSDFIKKQVCLIPINQDFNYTGLNIKLEKTNNGDEIIDVFSSDLIISGKGTQKDLEKICGKNIVLCRLRPSETITINNIKICEDITLRDSGKFSLISNISYEILDVDPIILTRSGQTGVSSMLSMPEHFKISYTTHRNIDKPLKLMHKCIDTLVDRLLLINKDMKNISNKDISYYSDLLLLETAGNLKKLQIIGEYWTVINLICRYCYILTKTNIQFVAPSLIHPEKEIGVISITHPEFSSLIQDSIKKIISELHIIHDAF